jgi:hypothetical protein
VDGGNRSLRLPTHVGIGQPRRTPGAVMSETLPHRLASVFAQGKFAGTLLHRGCQGYEAIDPDNASHGCYPSQKEAAAVLQQRALHDCVGCGD